MNTELDHLRAFAAADAAPDPAARAAARVALLERIEAAAPAAPVRPTRVRRPRRRLLTGGLGLAGVVAAAVAVALLVGPGGGAAGPTSASAAQLLRRAADVAAQGPDPVLAPGQYWYTRSESTSETTYGDAPPFSIQQQIRREAWIGRDGGGRVHQYSVGAPRFVGPDGRRNWIASGRPQLAMSMDLPLTNEDGSTSDKPYSLGAIQLTYAQLRALPTDVDTLAALVAREAHANDNSHGDAHEAFTIVGDVLREAPLPPALRAALYRVAARIPGVELLGGVRDAAGRPGVAVALRDPDGERAELIFDPGSAVLLGEREQDRDGTVGFESAYLESGVADDTQTRP